MTRLVLRIVFIIMALVGITFAIPAATAFACGEHQVLPAFLVPMAAGILLGFIAFLWGRKDKTILSTRASFATVALSWLSASVFGALPLYFSGAIPDVTNAFFESASGFTTTGATILNEIESLPRSINLWRCMTHWLGGMGIVALTVALLPVLGVEGFLLIKAETTGPEKGKFTTKITTTAKILWFIYLGMTAIETVLFMVAGMDFVDALSHSFSTMGTGGFSSRNSSIGSYNSEAIDWICIVFMFLAGINFSLYFYLFTGHFGELRRNTELKYYITLVLVSVTVITFIQRDYFGGFLQSLRYSAFQVASIISTTGFGTSDYCLWHPISQCVILALLFTGGCSGSTSGGVKVIRWVILGKQMKNELLHMLHPQGVFTIRLNDRPGRKSVVFSVTAFMFLFFILIGITTLIGCAFNMDIMTSFTGAASMVGNVGPAFGKLGPSFSCGWLATPVKWWYSFMMIAGRLELFTIFVFFIPDYWRK